MVIEFDTAKDAQNIAKHGVSLARAKDLIVAAAIEDARYNYGELRFLAFGYIDGVAHCLVYTVRGDNIRAISLRRAHAKEMKRYGL